MPVYKLNGKTYDIPDDVVADFENDNPDATISYSANGGKYDIPVSERDSFLNDFPDATIDDGSNAGPGSTKQPMMEAETKEKSGGYQPSAEDMAGFMGTIQNAGAVASGSLQHFDRKTENLKKRQGLNIPQRVNVGESNNLVQGEQKLNAETGKLENTYITGSGEQYDNKTLADEEQRQIDKYERDERYKESLPGQIEDTIAEGKRLDEEIAKLREGSHGRLMDAMYGGRTEEDADADSRLSTLLAAKRKNDERLKILEAERDDNGGTQFWRGFYDTITSPDTYSFGVTGLSDATQMLKLKRKIDQAKEHGVEPEFTEEEKSLIRSVENSQYAQQVFGRNRGSMYSFGSGFAQSLPFMFEIAATGGMGGLSEIGFAAGKKAATKLATAAVEKTMIRNLGKGGQWLADMAVKGSGALGGIAGGGLIMANTTGSAKTASDIIDRYVGDMKRDEAGNLKFEDGVSLGEAIYKGQLAQAFEYGSELVGDKYIEKYMPLIGEAALRTIRKLGPEKAKPFLESLLTNKLTKGIGKIKNSRYFEKGEKALNYAGVQGWFAEGMEEEANNILNAIFVGDTTWFKQDPNKPAVFDTKDQLELWEQTILTSAILRAPQMMQTAGKTAGYYGYKHATDVADANAASVFGENNWQMIREEIDKCTNEDLPALLETVVKGDMTQQQKEATIFYADNLLKMRGYNAALAAEGLGKKDEVDELIDDLLEKGYQEGRQAELPDDLKSIADDAKNAEEGLKRYGEDFATLVYSGKDHPGNAIQYLLENRNLFTDEQIAAAADYYQKQMRAEGMMDGTLDRIDTQVEKLNAEVRGSTHQATGNVVLAQNGDQQYYITGGDIVTDEAGNAVLAGTGGAVVAKNVLTGETKVMSPQQMQILNIQSADDLINLNNTAVRDQMIQQADEDISLGSPAEETFQQEDTVTLVDADGNRTEGVIVGVPNAIDGEYAVQTNDKNPGKAVQYFTADQMNRMIVSHNGQEVQRGINQNVNQNVNQEPEIEQNQAPLEQNQAEIAQNQAANEQQQPANEPANEQPQSALSRIPVTTDAQGKPILNKKGKPQYEWHKASVEDAAAALIETTGNDMVMARDTANDLVNVAKGKLEKIRKQKPKGEDPIEIAESRQEIRRAEQEQQAVIKQWQDVALNIGKQINAESERKRQEAEAKKSEEQKAREAEEKRLREEKQREIEQQRIREQIEKDKERRNKEYQPLVDARKDMSAFPEALEILNDKEPRSLEEWVSSLLRPHSLLWQDASDTEVGLQSELGLKRSDMQRFMSLLGNKESNAQPFGKAVLDIYESLPEGMKNQYTDEDVRNTLLDLFNEGNSARMLHLTEEHRIEEARETMLEQIRREAEAEMEAWAEAYHLTPEERETFEEFMSEQAQAMPNEQEFINQIIADEQQNSRGQGMDLDNTSGTAGRESEGGEEQVQGQSASDETGVDQQEQKTDEGTEADNDQQTIPDSDVSGGTSVANTIQGMKDITPKMLLDGLQSDIEEILSDNGLDDVTIKGLALHGSRMRGDARADSDLDVVMEYEGDISEDGLFNILNEAGMKINGIPIDVNPITKGKSGTLEQYMERSRKYDEEKKKIAPSEQLKPTDLRDAVRPESLELGVNEANAKAREAAGVQPVGNGDFGPIYDQFRGKPKEAIDFLTSIQEGEALGALTHKDIGDIDLVWGEEGTGHSDGYGLAKLVKYHPEVLENLQEILDLMEVVKRTDNRINLESDKYKAAVRLTWNDQSKTWLLTVFEKKNSALDNTTDTGKTSNRGKRNDTATPQSTVSEDKDTNNSANLQEKTEKSSEKVENQPIGKTSSPEKIEEEEAKVDTNPSEAQKEAGNYQKGHIQIDGYDITIENPKGSIRRGTDKNGNTWEQVMNNTYGYIRGTEAVDGDHIDIFLSDNPTSGNVYVIDQVDPETGDFDESKVMYSFGSEEEAREAYLSNYSKGWKGLGNITEVSREDFKKWIESSHRKTKPFAEYAMVKAQSLQRLKDVSELVKDLLGKYRSLAPVVVVDINSDDEIRKIIAETNGKEPTPEEFEREKKALKDSKLPASYNPIKKVIYIFADNIEDDYMEEIFFHENIHRGLQQYYGDNPIELAEAFWDTESPTKPEVTRRRKEIVSEAYKDKPQDIKEEYFVHALGHQMVTGSAGNIIARLSPEHQEIINNILYNIGYDTAEETKRRKGGADTLRADAEGRVQETGSERGGVTPSTTDKIEDVGEETANVVLYHKVSEAETAAPDSRETALRDQLIDLMKDAGIDMITDNAEGQLVLDKANGKAKESRSKKNNTPQPKPLRTKDGQAYGYTYNGKIYIDPSIATSETPIHEYTHLWAEALRQKDPETWKQIVDVLKNDEAVKPFWDKVERQYPELTDDNDIVEEVLAQYSGQRGSEQLREVADDIARENKGIFGKAQAIEALRKMKNILSKFWKAVADMMGWQFTSAQDIADKVLYDLLSGVKPNEQTETTVSSQDTETVKDYVLSEFNRAKEGDAPGERIPIGKLTDEGRKYLESVSGMAMKPEVSFILNASELRHIYNDHYGDNEKDKGNNIPLTDDDIRSIVDVVTSPDKIMFAVENKTGRKLFFFLKDAGNGTYNLAEVYADSKGNLTTKSFYKTKKSIAQRANELMKDPKLSTSETDGESSFSGANIPKLFETSKDFPEKVNKNVIRSQKVDDGRPRYQQGENALHYAERLMEYERQKKMGRQRPDLNTPSQEVNEYNKSLEKPEDFSWGKSIYKIPVKKTWRKYVGGLFREAWQDSMIALKRAQNAIVKASGEPLKDYEDAYTLENLSHGSAKNDYEWFDNNLYTPLLKTFHKMKKAMKATDEAVHRYMFAKHGLERNVVMAFRDAVKRHVEAAERDYNSRKKAYDEAEQRIKQKEKDIANLKALGFNDKAEQREKELNYLKAALSRRKVPEKPQTETEIHKAYQEDEGRIQNEKDFKEGRIDYRTYRERDDQIRSSYAPESYFIMRSNDYSGLTGMFATTREVNGIKVTDKPSVGEAENMAMNMAKDIEDAHGELTDDLWKKVNGCTKWTLLRSYQSGMISREMYDIISGMYDYYIPLRGWDGTNAQDVYDYVGGRSGVFSKSVIPAKGRTSVADNPIAYIGNMAMSNIIIGQQNMVKQRLLNLARNHRNQLLMPDKAWYENIGDEKDPNWVAVSADIPADASQEEIIRIIGEFEQRMKRLQADGKATQARGSLTISYPAPDPQLKEHEIRVMDNGNEYVIYVNGDPRVAQAVNGTRARKVRNGAGLVTLLAEKSGRFKAAVYTSFSPRFIITNWFRDMSMAITSSMIDKGVGYNAKAAKNTAALLNPFNPNNIFRMMYLYTHDSLDMNSPTQRMFKEFMVHGAETGFVAQLDLESFKNNINKELGRADHHLCDPRKGFRAYLKATEFVNRCIEDSTRFIVYKTSRQSGESAQKSAAEAKDVTLNFNRKGTGEMGNAFARGAYIFVNPSVQGIQTLFRLMKHHPYKFTAMTAGWIMGGAMQPYLNQMLMELLGPGDDDDKDAYWKLPEHIRRQGLVIYIGNGKFLTIPLAQEFRVFWGIGEVASTRMLGHSKGDYIDDGMDIVESFLDLLPFGLLSRGVRDKEFGSREWFQAMWTNFLPDIVKTEGESIANIDWTGKPLFKDNDHNKELPAWSKAYKGTPSWLVKATELLNENTGGEGSWIPGKLDWNPAIINHELQGWFGGPFNFFGGAGNVIYKAMNGEKINLYDIPILNGIVNEPAERDFSQNLGDEYWKMYREEYKPMDQSFGEAKRQAMAGNQKALESLERFFQSDDYKRYKEMKSLVDLVDKRKKAEAAGEGAFDFEYTNDRRPKTPEEEYEERLSGKDEFEEWCVDQIGKRTAKYATELDNMRKNGASLQEQKDYRGRFQLYIEAREAVERYRKERNERRKMLGHVNEEKEAETMNSIRRKRDELLRIYRFDDIFKKEEKSK